MIGPTWTVGAMPINSLIAAEKDIIVISPSVGVKEFNETSHNIFNTWPHDEKATRELAGYAIAQGWQLQFWKPRSICQSTKRHF
jgi:ABC-type branched-subunit amino acid transport system substrate-binding protein